MSKPLIQMSPDISLSLVSAARNLGVIFDSTLSMSDHISAVTKSCLFHIHDLRRNHHKLDLHIAKIIATPLVHYHLDYCNSLSQSSII